MHWPSGITKRNELVHTPCHFVDVLPTAIELSGGDPAKAHRGGAPPLPGRSLVQAMKTGASVEREHIYFHHLDNCAIRVGDRKALASTPDGPWSLYDLRTDRSEMHNLAPAQPGLAQKLAARWRDVEKAYVSTRENAPSFPSDAKGLQRLPGRRSAA
jgi:arylsulfatase